MLYNQRQEEKIKERLKELRGKKGLTQQSLVGAINEKYPKLYKAKQKKKKGADIISEGTIKQYESYSGRVSGMDIETLCLLADFHGVSVEYLLGISDLETPDIEVKGINKKTGLSEKAIGILIEATQGRRHIIDNLSNLIEMTDFIENILGGIMWLGLNAIHKLIFESEKKENILEPPSGETLGKPLYELFEDTALGEINRIMGGPVILNPSETYSFYLNELEKDFGKIVETLIEEMHKGKSLTDLKNEIDELNDGLFKS